jgi:hypothetical protein
MKDQGDVRINTNEKWEMEWWPWLLGISRKELIRAIQKAGPLLIQVKKYLSQNRMKHGT